jgi:lipoprotein-anchoring transpeptidase ErfK/SrfK
VVASAPVARIDVRSLESSGSRPVETVLEAQIALARLGISSGSIDGVLGSQTRSALIAFQRKKGIVPSGALDAETKSALLISLPAVTEYTVTADDLARLLPVSKTWLGKSEQPRMDFENIVELLGEKGFSHPQLIRELNPNVNWNAVQAGTTVTIPQVEYPPVADKAALVRISLQECVLEAFDEGSNLLVHFPCSIGRLAEKRPNGELHVATVALDPNYTFDPAVFPESPEAREVGRKLVIPPGPNNPVGVAWIGLDRPGYGIHGTPAPEQVGRTESHGCFRLANWNAAYLARLVWIGMPVEVE